MSITREALIAWVREQEKFDRDDARRLMHVASDQHFADEAFRRANHFAALLAALEAQQDVERKLHHWASLNNDERAKGKTPTFLNPWTALGWMGFASPDNPLPAPPVEVSRG